MKPVAEIVIDAEAAEINQWHYRATVGSVLAAWECGKRLVQKKATINEKWMPWVERNLDFSVSTAGRFMQLYGENSALTPNLNPKDAEELLRKLWSNKKDSELVQQSTSVEHYTPEKYIEAARGVLGEIDIDPASCVEANAIVRAKKFYTEADNGLTKQWRGRVWLNPPYGDEVGVFVKKLKDEIEAKRTTAAICLVNAHCTDTAWFQLLWGGMLCFTDHRINFYGDDKRSGSTHGSVFVYFGGERKGFANAFSTFGAVVESAL